MSRTITVITLSLSLLFPTVSEAGIFGRRVQSGGNWTWTWPGNLSDHLRREHGVDTTGLSQSQMIQLHNDLHNGKQLPKKKPVVCYPNNKVI